MAKAPAKGTFTDLLDRPATDFVPPPPIPAGTYVGVIKGLPAYGESSKKKTKQVEFSINLLEAMDDVDQEELKGMGGIAGKTVKATYYLTDDAIYRLREFLEHCGIEVGKQSIRADVDETPGKQVVVVMGHEAAEDGRIFSRVKRTAAVE